MDELLLSPALADVRVEFAIAEAEFEARAAARSTAAMFRAIDATLAEAEAHPEVFVDPPMLRGDAVELAVRAAVADLAVRLSIAEATVRAYAMTARTLRRAAPDLWQSFLDGEISTANAREAASIVDALPEPTRWAFEATVLEPAATLAPARFRSLARATAERLTAATATDRHRAAREERRVVIEHERDGMGWLHAYLPSDDLARIRARLDATAYATFTEPDNSRTMTQLRADALVDHLVNGTGVDAAAAVGVTVALTIPVLSLLGHDTALPVLDGVGPIDLDTARRLAAGAPSITRLLTDPVSGDVVAMDARQYRPTAALRRWLALTQVTCDFPGCGRRAEHCDLDHTVAWSAGGTTSAANLVHRCRKHHVMKHETRWRVEKPPGATRAVWTSPTGAVREGDGPPF